MCPVQQSRGAGCPGAGPHSASPQTLMKSQPTTLYPSSPKTLSTLGSGQWAATGVGLGAEALQVLCPASSSRLAGHLCPRRASHSPIGSIYWVNKLRRGRLPAGEAWLFINSSLFIQ